MTMDNGQLLNHATSALYPAGTDPRITVYGCGGAGTNIVSSIRDYGLDGVETVAINTDAGHLALAEADRRILLGQDLTGGGGAGGRPEVGERAAEADRQILREAVSCDIAFLVAGLGGGTGTGATPVLAGLVRRAGAVCISIAVMPFGAEGRSSTAEEGLAKLRAASDAVLVIQNDLLVDLFGELSVMESFGAVTAAVAKIVKTTAQRISEAFVGALSEDVLEVTRQAVAGPQGSTPMEVAPPPVVEAAAEIDPVAFDSEGFLGWG